MLSFRRWVGVSKGFLTDEEETEAGADGCSSDDESDFSEAARLDVCGGASWFSELCGLPGPLDCDSEEEYTDAR